MFVATRVTFIEDKNEFAKHIEHHLELLRGFNAVNKDKCLRYEFDTNGIT
jgi:hypothetical protein